MVTRPVVAPSLWARVVRSRLAVPLIVVGMTAASASVPRYRWWIVAVYTALAVVLAVQLTRRRVPSYRMRLDEYDDPLMDDSRRPTSADPPSQAVRSWARRVYVWSAAVSLLGCGAAA